MELSSQASEFGDGGGAPATDSVAHQSSPLFASHSPPAQPTFGEGVVNLPLDRPTKLKCLLDAFGLAVQSRVG